VDSKVESANEKGGEKKPFGKGKGRSPFSLSKVVVWTRKDQSRKKSFASIRQTDHFGQVGEGHSNLSYNIKRIRATKKACGGDITYQKNNRSRQGRFGGVTRRKVEITSIWARQREGKTDTR